MKSEPGRPNYGKSGKIDYPNTYTIWQKMIYRCHRPENPDYPVIRKVRWKDTKSTQ